ncbi:MAG: hypothetical protein Devi2KO_24040 [Devosia indica]
MTLPPIISFWHGPLSWLEVLCITAFVRRGHRVLVHSYDTIENLPAGAEWRDATALLPFHRPRLMTKRGPLPASPVIRKNREKRPIRSILKS